MISQMNFKRMFINSLIFNHNSQLIRNYWISHLSSIFTYIPKQILEERETVNCSKCSRLPISNNLSVASGYFHFFFWEDQLPCYLEFGFAHLITLIIEYILWLNFLFCYSLLNFTYNPVLKITQSNISEPLGMHMIFNLWQTFLPFSAHTIFLTFYFLCCIYFTCLVLKTVAGHLLFHVYGSPWMCQRSFTLSQLTVDHNCATISVCPVI